MSKLKFVSSVVVLAAVCGWLRADNGPGATKIVEKKGTRPTVVTPEREAAAMTFVTQHYPELSGLLVYLKHNPDRLDEYQRAVGDLFRTSERLAQYHGRDPERYEMELKLWKVKSQIEVLAARLQMSDTDDIRRELRAALQEQINLRQDLLADRISKLRDQSERLERDAAKEIDRQFKALTRATATPKRRAGKDKAAQDEGTENGATTNGGSPPQNGQNR